MPAMDVIWPKAGEVRFTKHREATRLKGGVAEAARHGVSPTEAHAGRGTTLTVSGAGTAGADGWAGGAAVCPAAGAAETSHAQDTTNMPIVR